MSCRSENIKAKVFHGWHYTTPIIFFWLVEKTVLRRPLLGLEASEIAFKARNIKLPMHDRENWCVVYIRYYRGRLADVRIIPRARLDEYKGEYWDDHVDLSVARQWKRYDKLGGRFLLRAVK
jgi:hypothetical protein